MKVFVQAKEMNVTQGIQRYVKQQVKKKISKLGQKVLGVRVSLEKVVRKTNDGQASQAKVQLQIPGKDIVVKQKSHDVYLAITSAIKASARQLRKLKDKRLAKRQRT